MMKLLNPTNLLTAAAILAAMNASFAEVINVDIQGSGSGGAASVAPYTGASANGPIASGTTWNHFTVGGNPPNGDFILNLNDDSGAPTTVDVTFGTGWLGSFADGAPNNLQGDRVFTAGGVSGGITIGGLTPSGAYNIALIAAVNGASAFSSDFTIGGTTLTATGATGAGTNANGPLTFTDGVTHVLFSNILADGSGNITFSMKNTAGASNGVLSGLQIESAVSDVTDPTVATLDPLDDATGVSTIANLVVTFDENVAFGTGSITIKESVGDAVVESFDVTSSPNLLLSGASVTINPSSNLAGSTGYYVQIDPTAIDDTAGNSFAGVSDTTTWNFTTASVDVTDPSVLTLSPADDAIDVAVGGNLSVTFDENVAFGTGDITLRQSGGALVEAFDVTSSPNLALSGATVTIDPSSDLSFNTDYYVEIAATAIDDLSGNSFAGISLATIWNFTTVDIVLYDDFSSDPELATKWTEYGYFPPDNTTPTWNSGDGDLDLSKPGGSHGFGLYRTGAQRLPTDPVRLTVNSLDRTSGTWGFMGLMISAVAQPGYIATADDSYTFALASLGGTNVRYEVRRTYQDGTSDFVLKTGGSFDLATHGPTTLAIVRNGAGDYEFRADGNLFYTSGDVAADTYDTAAKDSLVYFQIIQNGDGAMATTVDDFGVGVGPAPSPFDTWTTNYGLNPFWTAGDDPATDGRPEGDPDGDGNNNFYEFSVGFDPTVSDAGSLTVTSGTEFTPGDPIVVVEHNPFVIKMLYVRHKDPVTAGVAYTPKFSDSGGGFSEDPADPVPALESTQAGDYEVVSVPFLLFGSDGRKATSMLGLLEVNAAP